MKVKHFFCKKTTGNAEFIFLVECVYIRENSFQLKLESWLLLKIFMKMYYWTEKICILYVGYETCILDNKIIEK